MTISSPTLALAREYAAAGLPVIPLHPSSKRPTDTAWPDKATLDADLITAIWRGDDPRGIGVVGGHTLDAGGYLTILDIDEHDLAASGTEALHDLGVTLGALPATYTVLTPTGGRHLYYRTAAKLTNAAGSNLPAGIDIRGAGGFVVAPPSIHPDGGAYEQDLGSPPADKLAQLPAVWEEQLARTPDRTPKTPATPTVLAIGIADTVQPATG